MPVSSTKEEAAQPLQKKPVVDLKYLNNYWTLTSKPFCVKWLQWEVAIKLQTQLGEA